MVMAKKHKKLVTIYVRKSRLKDAEEDGNRKTDRVTYRLCRSYMIWIMRFTLRKVVQRIGNRPELQRMLHGIEKKYL